MSHVFFKDMCCTEWSLQWPLPLQAQQQSAQDQDMFGHSWSRFPKCNRGKVSLKNGSENVLFQINMAYEMKELR